jgi:hypothetical protein
VDDLDLLAEQIGRLARDLRFAVDTLRGEAERQDAAHTARRLVKEAGMERVELLHGDIQIRVVDGVMHDFQIFLPKEGEESWEAAFLRTLQEYAAEGRRGALVLCCEEWEQTMGDVTFSPGSSMLRGVGDRSTISGPVAVPADLACRYYTEGKGLHGERFKHTYVHDWMVLWVQQVGGLWGVYEVKHLNALFAAVHSKQDGIWLCPDCGATVPHDDVLCSVTGLGCTR